MEYSIRQGLDSPHIERYLRNRRRMNVSNKRVEEMVYLGVGMKVMVTQNVETDLDITNGAFLTQRSRNIQMHPSCISTGVQPMSLFTLKGRARANLRAWLPT